VELVELARRKPKTIHKMVIILHSGIVIKIIIIQGELRKCGILAVHNQREHSPFPSLIPTIEHMPPLSVTDYCMDS
jgi:hypothetical protein